MTASLDWPILIARWLFFASAMASFGMALFALYVPAPLSGSGLDSGLDPSLGRAKRLAASATLAASLAWFCLMVADEAEAPAAFLETARILLLETIFGRAWAVRLAAAFGLALTAARGRSPILQVVLSAIVLATEPWQGHMVERPALLQAAHIVHLLAAAAWLGGLLPLALAVRRALARPAERAHCTRLLARFSILGMICVVLVAATGICNTLTIVGPQSDFNQPYDRLLVVKLTLFAAMLAVAAMNRFQFMPLASETEATAFRHLRAGILLEQALALALLMVVADLGITDPAALIN